MSTVIELSTDTDTVTLAEDRDGFEIYHQTGDYSPTLVTLNHDAARALALGILARLEQREAARMTRGQRVLELV